MLKKVVQKCEKAMASTAMAVTKSSVNSLCMFIMYEPELPKGSERLKKKADRKK